MSADINRIAPSYHTVNTLPSRTDKDTLALLHTLTQKIAEIPPHIHKAGPHSVVEALRQIENEIVQHASQKQKIIIHAHIQRLINNHSPDT